MKRIVVSGGSGYIGSALVKHLVARGDEVTVLTRGAARDGNPRSVTWDPYTVGDWAKALDGADAVVHLAGERAVGARYTEAVKRRIYDSRIVSTKNVVTAMGQASVKPRVFVSASAVGYYGNRPSSVRVDESSPPGDDFLARLCVDWEAASEEARDLGIRVVNPRIGIVFGPGDGPLKVMAMPFRFFVGGKLGSGQQGISWIHLDDAVRALTLCIDDEAMPPKVNICSPNPASNAEISDAIAKVLGRPSWLTAPSFGLKLLFGEGAETILTGQFVVPGVLQKRAAGAPVFERATLAGALQASLQA
ncbi:MAG TPA: TIGR01777 family oxidoreductase [Polyangiaceae bacterium]|nr:TIGR01777 family oxidoreductase [Polyangiaceae bacterium]